MIMTKKITNIAKNIMTQYLFVISALKDCTGFAAASFLPFSCEPSEALSVTRSLVQNTQMKDNSTIAAEMMIMVIVNARCV